MTTNDALLVLGTGLVIVAGLLISIPLGIAALGFACLAAWALWEPRPKE